MKKSIYFNVAGFGYNEFLDLFKTFLYQFSNYFPYKFTHADLEIYFATNGVNHDIGKLNNYCLSHGYTNYLMHPDFNFFNQYKPLFNEISFKFS